jgi:CRP-like cAMP-binding protein
MTTIADAPSDVLIAAHRSTTETAELLAPYERVHVYAPGTVLFREGEEPDGVYYVHSGEVTLNFSSPKGGAKSLLLAGAGEIVGLTCVMSARRHDCSATARTTCITGFVEKNRFLTLLEEKPALWLTVLRMISSNINACWDCMRNLAAR